MRPTIWSQSGQTVGCCPGPDEISFQDIGLPDLGGLTLDWGVPNLVHILSVGNQTVIIRLDTTDHAITLIDEAQSVLNSIAWAGHLDQTDLPSRF